MSLPVEILSMVSLHSSVQWHPILKFSSLLGFVHPRTLLVLARSSRQSRELLTKRSTRSIRIFSIDHAGIPACPVDLEEFAYLSLVYQAICSVSVAMEFPTTYIGHGRFAAAVAASLQGNHSSPARLRTSIQI